MHSIAPPTDDEAVARDDEAEELEFFEDVPPYCGAGWRWGPFLLVGLFSWFAAGYSLRPAAAVLRLRDRIRLPGMHHGRLHGWRTGLINDTQ